MSSVKWRPKKYDHEAAALLSTKLGIHQITAKLLTIRGIKAPEEAERFLYSEGITDLADPFLLKDMDKAVNRIKRALADGERICIYGDYDVDGVTSTTILYKYLKSRGYNCGYFIPERLTEGYGLNENAVRNLAKQYSLIITVDNGVTAVNEAALAKELGVDLVITDHHSCRDELPDAVAVVNPNRQDDKYPFKPLAGVGVAFKLLCALEGDTQKISDEYSDLAALGTVADVMPLTGENRTIVKEGLLKISAMKNVGLTALMKCSGIIKQGKLYRKVNSTLIGFVLAPRLNAAGRIAKAEYAVELLLEEDEARADELAVGLCDINKQRQETESEIFEEVKAQIEEQPDKAVIVCGSSGWHQGVVGIVASKIVDRYSKPCILFSFDNGVAKGSARSVKGFNIIEALAECSDLLTEYGGHELAAGLTIDIASIDAFMDRINECAESMKDTAGESIREPELECDFSDISVGSIKEILRLEPFGTDNPQPLLMMSGVVLDSVVPVGNAMHVKLSVVPEKPDCQPHPLTAMCFGTPFDSFQYKKGDVCDLLFCAELNEYNGYTSPQLLVKAIRKTERDESEVPTIEHFRELYKSLRSAGNKIVIDFRNNETNPERIKFMLDVLEDVSLLEYIGENNEHKIEVRLLPYEGRVDIEASELLRKARSGGQGINI
ncbi:MAG: single-stranded-DNA-specific exonuclease RecJ [Eubacteriales bacterium]|nr:single-stranded-DNA-specific exonuclease RecJ [Eubacteriales bacterium]MDD4475095.1 single-stranded-DNA-specific exonuclease RecJ [Eubacteriales bacterium]